MDLLEAARAVRERRISSEELTRQALDRVARLNPALNAFITVTKTSALKRAKALDAELVHGEPRGPLHGIPIAHKDCFATAGVLTTGGSKILAKRVPEHDAAMVAALDQAGAVMVGKTNLHELCYGVTSANPHFGAVHNPFNLERIPGGSSGGSAAAVAAGLAFAATGTDTGGSIRIPAAFCGVVGLKPTYGSLSRRGCLPLGITLDHMGPIARTVRDTAAVYIAMGGTGTIPEHGPEQADLTGLRAGIPENYFFDHLEPEVRAAVRRAVQTIAALGAQVREVHLPYMEELNQVGRMILSAEAASLWKKEFLARPADFGEDLQGAFELGCRIPAADYLIWQKQRRAMARKLAAVWDRLDFLVMPAAPVTAPKIGQTMVRIGKVEEDLRPAVTRLVRPFNVLGWPALSMPCGFSGGLNALPIGLQIVAAPKQEDVLLRVAAALEDALDLLSHGSYRLIQ